MLNHWARYFLEKSTGRVVLILTAAALLSFAVFGIVLTPMFEAATEGLRPIDLSFPTTPELLYSHLPRYTAGSYRAYAWFAAFDFVWPVLLAVWLISIWAWCQKRSALNLFGGRLPLWLLLLPLLPALLDWLENLGWIVAIYSYPVERWGAASFGSYAKFAKVAIHPVNSLVTLALLATTVIKGRVTPAS